MSISGLLNISWNALTSNQMAMNITGANIANVNTPGYTRQTAEISATGRVDIAADQTYFGVEVSSVRHFYDRYLEMQLTEQSQRAGYDEKRQEILAQIEGVFSESGDSGLNELLNQFWNSWESLSTNPANQVARYSAVNTADNLAALFNENSNVLINVQQDIKVDMGHAVDEVNALTREIADLNQQILSSGSGVGNTNTLEDRRLELIKELSRNVNISYYENDDGTISTFLSGGMLLVGGNKSAQLSVTDGQVFFADRPSDIINDLITGGKIGAMIAMGETTLQGYMDNLDQLANGIVAAVNTQHQAGLDSSGVAGGLFFAASTGARNMAVSAAIRQDPLLVAASDLAGNNGENARLIGALKDSLAMNGGATTFNDYYALLVGRVGYDVKDVEGSIERTLAVTNQLTEQREKISGVSLDEEIIALIQYQFGYNAAGKLVSIADELVDTLLSLAK